MCAVPFKHLFLVYSSIHLVNLSQDTQPVENLHIVLEIKGKPKSFLVFSVLIYKMGIITVFTSSL